MKTTFDAFLSSREFVPDLSKSWLSDFISDELEGCPGFVYRAWSRYPNYNDQLVVYIEIGRDGFCFDYQGYPHLDCFISLDACEKYAWNAILKEDWGVEGDPIP